MKVLEGGVIFIESLDHCDSDCFQGFGDQDGAWELGHGRKTEYIEICVI